MGPKYDYDPDYEYESTMPATWVVVLAVLTAKLGLIALALKLYFNAGGR